MGISGRNAVLLFTGGLDIAFGVIFILYGVDSVILFAHGAVGVTMWAGIGIVMVGIGNILAVLTASKKRNREYLNINFGSLLLNLTGMILAACVIGFYTWGAWSVLTIGLSNTNTVNDRLISIYSSVILMAAILFIVSLMAMFMDCCSYALFGSGGDYYGPPPRPRYYDGQYGPPPAHIYKP
ncbi:uncharacterized protein LOC119725822 [Patiria miniata]|uniref:Uncharacterized protein n=1 Tax=Patiria miniata TaxID=46514 RepID=A0A913ZQI9_PATMI|nr:uncharacterized protein LOC119725822 [Patiria miniata]